MARIVVNPHKENASDINRGLLQHKGEILICNEINNEGIYVLNNRRELVRVGINMAKASSAVTEDDLTNLEIRLNDVITNATQSVINNTYTKEETDNRILEVIGDYSGITIDEEAVREIVEDEIAGLIEELSGVTNEVADIETVVSGLTENISGIDNRVEYLEGVVSGVTKSTDHFVMTFDQYQELITNGNIYIEKYGTITYNDDHFYCIYEEDTPQPTPSSGTVIMSGNTIILNESYPYEGGDVPSLYIGTVETSGNGVVQVDWPIDRENDDAQTEDVDIEGDTISINNTVYNSGEPLNIGTIDDNGNGVVDVPWEI